MTTRLIDTRESDKENFAYQHFTHYESVDGQHVWALTGIVFLHPHLRGTGEQWVSEDFVISLSVPGIPDGKALKLKHWAPHIALNAISNDHSAQWAGWAVDWFVLENPQAPSYGSINISTRAAVRDVDGWTHRLSYIVHLVGTFIEAEAPD